MSKAEILAELPRLSHQDRRAIMSYLLELEPDAENNNAQARNEIADLINKINEHIPLQDADNNLANYQYDIFACELDKVKNTIASLMSDYPKGADSSFDMVSEDNKTSFKLSYLDKQIEIELSISLTARNARKVAIKSLDDSLKERAYFLKVRRDANFNEEYVWGNPQEALSSDKLAKTLLIGWLNAVMPEA